MLEFIATKAIVSPPRLLDPLLATVRRLQNHKAADNNFIMDTMTEAVAIFDKAFERFLRDQLGTISSHTDGEWDAAFDSYRKYIMKHLKAKTAPQTPAAAAATAEVVVTNDDSATATITTSLADWNHIFLRSQMVLKDQLLALDAVVPTSTTGQDPIHWPFLQPDLIRHLAEELYLVKDALFLVCPASFFLLTKHLR